MKKLLNIMLATFLVFTVVSFAVSAEDGATGGVVAVASGNQPGTSTGNQPGTSTGNQPGKVDTVVIPGANGFDMKFEIDSNAKVDETAVEAIKNGNVTPKVTELAGTENTLEFDVKPLYVGTENEVNTNGIKVTFKLNVGSKFAAGAKVRVTHFGDNGEIKEVRDFFVEADGYVVVDTTRGFSVFKVELAPATTNTTTPTPAGSKDTNKDGVISCEEEMGSKNWIWSDAKKACVYKVSNTSVK